MICCPRCGEPPFNARVGPSPAADEPRVIRCGCGVLRTGLRDGRRVWSVRTDREGVGVLVLEGGRLWTSASQTPESEVPEADREAVVASWVRRLLVSEVMGS